MEIHRFPQCENCALLCCANVFHHQAENSSLLLQIIWVGDIYRPR